MKRSGGEEKKRGKRLRAPRVSRRGASPPPALLTAARSRSQPPTHSATPPAQPANLHTGAPPKYHLAQWKLRRGRAGRPAELPLPDASSSVSPRKSLRSANRRSSPPPNQSSVQDFPERPRIFRKTRWCYKIWDYLRERFKKRKFKQKKIFEPL